MITIIISISALVAFILFIHFYEQIMNYQMDKLIKEFGKKYSNLGKKEISNVVMDAYINYKNIVSIDALLTIVFSIFIMSLSTYASNFLEFITNSVLDTNTNIMVANTNNLATNANNLATNANNLATNANSNINLQNIDQILNGKLQSLLGGFAGLLLLFTLMILIITLIFIVILDSKRFKYQIRLNLNRLDSKGSYSHRRNHIYVSKNGKRNLRNHRL